MTAQQPRLPLPVEFDLYGPRLRAGAGAPAHERSDPSQHRFMIDFVTSPSDWGRHVEGRLTCETCGVRSVARLPVSPMDRLDDYAKHELRDRLRLEHETNWAKTLREGCEALRHEVEDMRDTRNRLRQRCEDWEDIAVLALGDKEREVYERLTADGTDPLQAFRLSVTLLP